MVQRTFVLSCLLFGLSACGSDNNGTGSPPVGTAASPALCGAIELACVCPGGGTGTLTCDGAGNPTGCACADGTGTGNSNDNDAGSGNGNTNDNSAPPPARNACGGTGALSYNGAAAAPLDPCGVCGDGVLVCEASERLSCIGATPLNACGACGRLDGSIGDPCGPCGDGALACASDQSGENTGQLSCLGATSLNACGGCEVLEDAPAFACLGAGDEPGIVGCVTKNTTQCISGGQNACGGTNDLGSRRPLDSCGACGGGVLVCADTERLTCVDDDVGVNACGGCSVLRGQPGTACGACGGAWVCDGPDAVRCNAPVNACGGCSELTQTPNAACGIGRLVVCTSAESVECIEAESDGEGNFTNACGGLGALDVAPGSSCGPCERGRAVCAGPNETTCIEDGPSTNACGGCDPLPDALGASCGFNSVFTCSGEPVSGDPLRCEFVGPTNVCGGQAAIEEFRQPGESCGECGTYWCVFGDTVCIGATDTNTDAINCGACGVRCGGDESCLLGECVRETAVQLAISKNGAGAHGCVVTEAGRVRCFGANDRGQLGDGTGTRSADAVTVANISAAVQVQVGEDHSCARLADGRVVCWGENDVGQLGWAFGTVPSLNAPNVESGTVTGISQALDLATSDELNCAVEASSETATSGVVVCWGRGRDAIFGVNSSAASVYPPTQIAGLSAVVDVEVASDDACALTEAGEVYCWGDSPPLDTGTSRRTSPTRVNTLAGVEQFDMNASHACAVNDIGEVLCWGFNNFNRLGRPGGANGVQAIPGLDDAVDVSTAFESSCALMADTTVVCWGRAEGVGRSLLGGSDLAFLPVAGLERIGPNPDAPYTAMTGARGLVSGSSVTTCALRDEGEIRCWGSNIRNIVNLDFTRANTLDTTVVGRPTPLPRFGPQLSEFARCTDGVDNDGDGAIDCVDRDCALDLGSAVGIQVMLQNHADWGEYERVDVPLSQTFGHKTIRFTWTAPRSGNFTFAVNTAGGGNAQGRVDLKRTSCTAVTEAGGASPSLVVAAGETLFGVMEVLPTNTKPLVQLDIIEN